MNTQIALYVWLQQTPIFRFLLALIAGIILQHFVPLPNNVLLVGVCICFFGLLTFSFLNFYLKFRLQKVRGLLAVTAIVLSGALLVLYADARKLKNWYGNINNSESNYQVSVIEEPIINSKTVKLTCNVAYVINNNIKTTASGKIFIYLPKDSVSEKITYGNVLLFNGALQVVNNYGHPGEFNYKGFLARKNIYHMAYLTNANYIITPEKNGNAAFNFLIQSRQYVLAALRQHFSINGTVLGVAEAMVLGYNQDINKELYQAYADTGVVHVIAISGMHLGLIFVSLTWLFARMPWVKHRPAIAMVLVLVFIWFFVLLTGASPSILRAGIMYSCVVLANLLQAEKFSYNILLLAAFVMLLFNPLLLFDMSFQLSYAALLSIMLFQYKIGNIFWVKNKSVKLVWSLISTTLAAQILVTPIILYYFHQFPLVFLLANLVAIPISNFALIGLFLLLIFNSVPYLSTAIAFVLNVMLGFLNKATLFFNNIPYASLQQIPTNGVATFLCYVLIAIWALGGLVNPKKLRLPFLICGLCIVFYTGFLYYTSLNTKAFVVYNIPKHSAVEVISNGTSFLLADSVVKDSTALFKFHIKPTHRHFNCSGNNPGLLKYINNHIYTFNNQTILLVDSGYKAVTSPQKININFAILSHNAKINIQDLTQAFLINQFIFDASNSKWKIEKWKTQCNALTLRHHSVPELGTFTKEW
jgi:competence protein ComEC